MIIFIKLLLRKKEFKFYLFIFILLYTLLLLIINSYIKIDNNINDKKNYHTNREINISTDDDFELIKSKIKNFHIEKIYPRIYITGEFKTDAYNIETFIVEKKIDIIKGRIIKNDNEIILSKQFVDYLNEYIILKIDDINYEMKVVGIFDDINLNHTIFVYDNSIFNNENWNLGYNLLIDDTSNVDDVISKLEKIGYYANVIDKTNNVDNLILIRNILTLFIVVLVICIFLLSVLIIKNIILDSTKDIAILKSIGYSLKDISTITLIQNCFICFISYIITLLINIVISLIFKYQIYLVSIILLFSIIVFSIIFNIIILRKKLLKLNPIVLYYDSI